LIFDFQKQFRIDFSGGVAVEKLYEDEFGAKRNADQIGAFFGEAKRGTFIYFGEAGFNKTFNKRISIDGEIGFSANTFDLDFGASERYPRVSPAYLQYLIARKTNPNLEEPPLDPGKSFLFRYELEVDLQPTDPLNISFSYDRRLLTRNDTDLVAFDSNIFSLRTTYQFTRFIFSRARFDYETVEGSINSQLLFGINPSPGTAFYVGYNDNSFYRGFNEFDNRFDGGFRRDGRSFFIRASYLFRKSF
jgi:hypothetical protein